jgi:hypothetical protein
MEHNNLATLLSFAIIMTVYLNDSLILSDISTAIGCASPQHAQQGPHAFLGLFPNTDRIHVGRIRAYTSKADSNGNINRTQGMIMVGLH